MRTHGTVSSYKDGCRCQDCRDASAAARRDARRRQAPQPPPVCAPVGWEDQAACKGTPRTVFFPSGRDRLDDAVYVTALNICRKCPVQVECLRTARLRNEPCGVWGGVIFDPPARSVRPRKKAKRTDGDAIAADVLRLLTGLRDDLAASR